MPQRAQPIEITCAMPGCGEVFETLSTVAKYCPACRPAAYRRTRGYGSERECDTPDCTNMFPCGKGRRYCDACRTPEAQKQRNAASNRRTKAQTRQLEKTLKGKTR